MPAARQPSQADPAVAGLLRLIERVMPWLVDVGTWVFGGLIAVNLVIVAALITVGPVDRAVLIATAAFACALPLDVAGMTLLRFGKDVDSIRLEDLALRAFKDAEFPSIEAYFPPARRRGSIRHRRARVTLGYVLAIAVVASALTIVGMVASVWHMAPWVGESSLGAIVVSLLLIVLVFVHSMPPESQAGDRLKTRSSEKPT